MVFSGLLFLWSIQSMLFCFSSDSIVALNHDYFPTTCEVCDGIWLMIQGFTRFSLFVLDVKGCIEADLRAEKVQSLLYLLMIYEYLGTRTSFPQ